MIDFLKFRRADYYTQNHLFFSFSLLGVCPLLGQTSNKFGFVFIFSNFVLHFTLNIENFYTNIAIKLNYYFVHNKINMVYLKKIDMLYDIDNMQINFLFIDHSVLNQIMYHDFIKFLFNFIIFCHLFYQFIFIAKQIIHN